MTGHSAEVDLRAVEGEDPVRCAHARTCAGCPLIELPYSEQLRTKCERVKAAVAPYPSLSELRVEATAPATPRVAYRIRAKLMVAGSNGSSGPSLGLYARAADGAESHQVVDIPGCRVLSPSLHQLAAGLRSLLGAPPPDAGPCLVPEASGGLLSAFDLREIVDRGETKTLVTFVLAGERATPEEIDAAARAVRDLSSSISGVAVNFRETGSVQVLGPTTRCVAGTSAARDEVSGVYRLATFGSFTQVHREQAARIEEWIESRLNGDGSSGRRAGAARNVLDLYGGSGALSLPMARRGTRVTLVESFRPAADSAARAAKEQGFAGYEARSGDAAAVLRDIATRGERFDAVITNPPRGGMSPPVRTAVAALEPEVVAYVSCDPETLCRDLDHLARLGYRTEALQPVDMIPLTDQVEVVAFLTRAARPSPRVVYEDDDIVVVDRQLHDPPIASGSDPVGARLVPTGREPNSGLTLACKSQRAKDGKQKTLTRSRSLHIVLAKGIAARDGVVNGRTRYKRLARVAGHSVLCVSVGLPDVGRIEGDLARIGHPVIGDARHGHGPTNRHFEKKHALDRPFFHCLKVEFDHPTTGERIEARGTLPGELTMVLGRLGLVALDVTEGVMVG